MKLTREEHQCVGWADSQKRGTCPTFTNHGLCQFCTKTLERYGTIESVRQRTMTRVAGSGLITRPPPAA